MGKIKVTQKEIKESWRNIVSIGYCEAQYLLSFKEAKMYSCGIYGWKCDYYIIDNSTIISTGYAPVGNLSDYKLVREYDKKASEILSNRNLSYDEKKLQVNNLLDEFIAKILDSKNNNGKKNNIERGF